MLPTFHRARRADIDLLVGFVREFYMLGGIPFDEQTTRRALAGLIDDPTLGRLWVMRRGDAAIGYVVLTLGYSLEYGSCDAFVDEVFVREDCRGQGAGTAALRFVAATCRQLGVRALHLEVEQISTAAQRLSRRAGFQDHDRYLMTVPIAG